MGGATTTVVAVPTILTLAPSNTAITITDQGSNSNTETPSAVPEQQQTPKPDVAEEPYSIPNTPVLKQKERHEHPELCKEVLVDVQDKSKLRVCRLHRKTEELEFEYLKDQFSTPISVTNLQFKIRDLAVTLDKADMSYDTIKRFTLTDEIIAGQGIISQVTVGGNSFTGQQCKLVWKDNLDSSGHKDWKVGC